MGYLQNLKSPHNPLSRFPSQSRQETGVPVTVGGISHPMTEFKIENSMTLKKSKIRYLVTARELPKSSNHMCNPVQQKDDALSSNLNQANFYSFSTKNNLISIIKISLCKEEATVCADTGTTHSVDGEKL